MTYPCGLPLPSSNPVSSCRTAAREGAAPLPAPSPRVPLSSLGLALSPQHTRRRGQHRRASPRADHLQGDTSAFISVSQHLLCTEATRMSTHAQFGLWKEQPRWALGTGARGGHTNVRSGGRRCLSWSQRQHPGGWRGPQRWPGPAPWLGEPLPSLGEVTLALPAQSSAWGASASLPTGQQEKSRMHRTTPGAPD